MDYFQDKADKKHELEIMEDTWVESTPIMGCLQTSIDFIRKGLIVTAFISLSLAFMVPSVVKLWYLIGSIFVPGLVIPFLLSFSRKKYSILPVMICPVVVGLLWTLIGKFLGEYPLNLEPFYPGIMTSLLMYVLKGKNG